MKIVCSVCGAEHWLPDGQVASGSCTVTCPGCSASIYADASMADPQSLEPRWYYACENDTVGPISAKDLEAVISSGKITLSSYVWCDGMADWMALDAVPEFAYLRSPLMSSAPGDNLETGVGDAVPSFADFAEDDMRTCAGEETAAIDLKEFEQNGLGALGGAAAAADDEPVFNMSEEELSNSANDMLGAPNESSVLFSLSSLQAVAPAPASEIPADPSLSLKNMGSPVMSRRRTNEVVDSFGGSSMPMATVLPLGTKKDNKPLFIILGIVGAVLVIVIALLAVFVVTNSNNNQGPVQSANLDANKALNDANNLGVEPSAVIAAKAAEEEAAKKAAEEEAAKKAAEEEAAKKAAEEEAAKKAAEEEAAAKAAEEEAAAKAAEEEAAKAAEEAKKTAKKDTKAPAKTETKAPAKTETKAPAKAETKPAAAPAASTLTKADIQSAIRGVSGDIRSCSRTSTTKGTMKVSFTIKGDGRVSGAKVVSPEFAGTPTAACVLKVLNGVKFKAGGADTPIANYPIPIQ